MNLKLRILIFLFVTSILPIYGLANTTYTAFESVTFQSGRDFIISPNPASQTLNVYLPNGFENSKLTVFDVLGKEIFTVVLNKLHSSINISKWNSGIYLVRISTETTTQTKRFVKQ
jgi:hypothetical protein